jgi:hypothetical protein
MNSLSRAEAAHKAPIKRQGRRRALICQAEGIERSLSNLFAAGTLLFMDRSAGVHQAAAKC